MYSGEQILIGDDFDTRAGVVRASVSLQMPSNRALLNSKEIAIQPYRPNHNGNNRNGNKMGPKSSRP